MSTLQYFAEVANDEQSFSALRALPDAIEVSPQTSDQILRLTLRLLARKKPDASLALISLAKPAIEMDPNFAKAHAMALHGNRKFAQSMAICEKFARFVKDDAQWMLLDADNAYHMEDAEKALAKTEEYCAQVPYRTVEARGGQADMTLCIVTSGPEVIDNYRKPLNMRLGGNFTSQIVRRGLGNARYVSVVANSRRLGRGLRKMDKPDLLINGVTHGERLGNKALFDAAVSCANQWDIPVLNRPEAAYDTARDKLYQLIRDIPGVLAPKTQFFRFAPEESAQDMLSAVEKEFEYPVILRNPMFQDGIDMELCENATEALEVLPKLDGTFYAIEFIKNQPVKGIFRKIRVVFIGDNLHLTRMDHGTDWKIHGHRGKPHRVAFYDEHPELLQLEIDASEDPPKFLGENVVEALRAMRSAIKLDYFGIDFDITEDQKVLVFEANANMNLMGKANMDRPHPPAAEKRMVDDFFAMVRQRIADHKKR